MKALRTQGLALLTILISAVCASAQEKPARTITNTDLEKYRDARVKADDEYRQTYAEKGLPSPEELEKRVEESQKRLGELSNQLEGERRFREYVEMMSTAAAANNKPQMIYVTQDNFGSGLYPLYSVGGFQFGKGVQFRNLSNTQIIRDQANTNRITPWNFGRSGFRVGFRSGGRSRPVSSPRR